MICQSTCILGRNECRPLKEPVAEANGGHKGLVLPPANRTTTHRVAQARTEVEHAGTPTFAYGVATTRKNFLNPTAAGTVAVVDTPAAGWITPRPESTHVARSGEVSIR